MEFFCYHRDRPGSGALRDELLEAHWTYMDHYEKELIARGPTFADDDTATGSVHIVDLPETTRHFQRVRIFWNSEKLIDFAKLIEENLS